MIGIIGGCDRTGTHMILDILKAHPEVTATGEKWNTFDYSSAMAYNRETIPVWLPRLLDIYDRHLRRCKTKWYIDKSHMNIWITDPLVEKYPNIKFILTNRSAYGTLSSMLEHQGVLYDTAYRWRSVTMPCPFLGVFNYEDYERVKVTRRCFEKWRVHDQYINHLVKETPKRIHVADYEKFIDSSEEECNKLFQFLEIEKIGCPIEIKKDSRDRWKETLSDVVIRLIDRELKERVGV